MTESWNCHLCGGWGWITCVDEDGSGYEIACPEGCPTQPVDDDEDAEVPF